MERRSARAGNHSVRCGVFLCPTMSRAYLKRDDFVKAVNDGSAVDGLLRKQFVCDEVKAVSAGDTPSRVRNFIVSTAAVDRDNDSISPKGWKLDNYRKNPVVLFAHDYTSLPVGKCTEIKVVNGQLIASCEFADHDMASTVMRLVDGGFLNATSVGFRPIKYQLNDERRGVDFEEQELLEYSIVPVPANPEALLVARELVGDVAALKSWAQKTLDVLDDEKGKRNPPPPPNGDTDHDGDADSDTDNDGKAAMQPGQPNCDDKDDKGKVPPADSGDADNDADADEPDDKKKPKFDMVEVAKLVARAIKGGCECMATPNHDPVACSCCSSSGMCQCSDCAHMQRGTDDAVEKRGRVLSARNEAKVRAAHAHLCDVLDSLPDYGGSDEADAAQPEIEKTDKTVESVIDLDDAAADVLDVVEASVDKQQNESVEITVDDIRAAMKDVLGAGMRESIAELVKAETQSALNRMRGIVD